ncbi:hypothetical protein [Fervidicoccus sp.]|uniref:hypothetical protein n=1 Tax=Fervidicoccus sp. TaxID=2060324 RepID=UPI003D0E8284
MKKSSDFKTVYIFDTGAFLTGLHLSFPFQIYTVKEVVDEVKDFENKSKLEYTLSANRIIIEEVEDDLSSLNKKLSKALSKADRKLINLALKKKGEGFNVVVFTDDYKIQEALLSVGIEFKPIRYRSIKR